MGGMLTHFQVWGNCKVITRPSFLASRSQARCGCGWRCPEKDGLTTLEHAIARGYEHEQQAAFEFDAFEMGTLPRTYICAMALHLVDMPGLHAAVIAAIERWSDERRQRFAATCEQALIAEVWGKLDRGSDVEHALSLLVRDTLLPSRDVPSTG